MVIAEAALSLVVHAPFDHLYCANLKRNVNIALHSSWIIVFPVEGELLTFLLYKCAFSDHIYDH